MGSGIDVLVNGAYGGVELGGGDGLGELLTGGLHQRGVERAADLQGEGTLGTGGLGGLAGGVDSLDFAGNHNLPGAVVVGGDDNAVYTFADFLNLLVREGDDGSHGGGLDLAGFLHGLRTGADQFEAILEAEGSGGGESRKLAERVSGNHLGLELVANHLR